MRTCIAWIPALAATSLLFAQENPSNKLRIEKTQSIDFTAGGLVRVKNSTGMLSIEAWDKPTVELTTVKSAKYMLNAKDREKASAELAKVAFSAERHGKELEVATTVSGHTGLIDVAYHLWVPRDTRLAITHGNGEVNVEGVAADIEATLRHGNIFLYLPEDVAYVTNAQCKIGGINVPGDPTLKPVHFHLGRSLVQEGAPKAHTLNLRVGYGDIYIMKQTPAPKPAPATVTSATY